MKYKKHDELEKLVNDIFEGDSTPQVFDDILDRIKADPKRSFGKTKPWAWWVETTRGCNLACGFCAVRLFPKGKFEYMTMETWKDLMTLISIVTPHTRVEIANAGEPTLNPQFVDFMRVGREICPTVQLMTYTNGTTLIDGTLTYKELFEAGLNAMFVDMYHPREKHKELAEQSGYQWFFQDKKPANAPNVFEYQNNPDFKCIMLSLNPGDWPAKKVKRGAFGTFFNNLDWDAAKHYGLYPITDPPQRRCDLPSRFVPVHHDGEYNFCCFDFMRIKAGEFGNVSDGPEGFFKFWFGEYMQATRKLLHNKDRVDHKMCSKCAFHSIRGDMIPWKPIEILDNYWDGEKWIELHVDMPNKPVDKRTFYIKNKLFGG